MQWMQFIVWLLLSESKEQKKNEKKTQLHVPWCSWGCVLLYLNVLLRESSYQCVNSWMTITGTIRHSRLVIYVPKSLIDLQECRSGISPWCDIMTSEGQTFQPNNGRSHSSLLFLSAPLPPSISHTKNQIKTFSIGKMQFYNWIYRFSFR